MKFDWDAAKAANNRRKHGVSFDESESVFGAAVIFEDLDHSEKEPRYVAIGFSARNRLLTVAFTRREPDVIRIISARKATKREQAKYVEAQQQND